MQIQINDLDLHCLLRRGMSCSTREGLTYACAYGVGLTLCCFVVYTTQRFVLSLVLCYSVLVIFSPFSTGITSLGEKRANLSAFSYVCWICACLVLSISSSSWCLGRAAACDCGTSWTFLFSFFHIALSSR